jgi:hypothetical protein
MAGVLASPSLCSARGAAQRAATRGAAAAAPRAAPHAAASARVPSAFLGTSSALALRRAAPARGMRAFFSRTPTTVRCCCTPRERA